MHPAWIVVLSLLLLIVLAITLVLIIGEASSTVFDSVKYETYSNEVKLAVKVDGRDYKEVQDKRTGVDLVYTWVDGTDPEWRKLKDSYVTNKMSHGQNDFRWPDKKRKKDELYYSIKSVYKFFPEFRYIWIVAQRPQTPSYLDEFDERVRLVFHDEFFYDTVQPTFNSHAIEANLHNISGLSKRFIYMNDDFFFGKKCTISHFFDKQGRSVFRGGFWPWWLFGAYFHPFLRSWNNIKNKVDGIKNKAMRIQILDHYPVPMTREICYQARRDFKEELDNTASHRFRDGTDIPPIGFALYYAGLNNKAVVYENDPITLHTIHTTIHTWPDYHIFCLNAFQGDKSFETMKRFFEEEET